MCLSKNANEKTFGSHAIHDVLQKRMLHTRVYYRFQQDMNGKGLSSTYNMGIRMFGQQFLGDVPMRQSLFAALPEYFLHRGKAARPRYPPFSQFTQRIHAICA